MVSEFDVHRQSYLSLFIEALYNAVNLAFTLTLTIFYGDLSYFQSLGVFGWRGWDRMVFMVSLWCYAHGCFKGISNIKRDWSAFFIT